MATKKETTKKKVAAKKAPAKKKTTAKKPTQEEQTQAVAKPLPIGKGPLGYTTSNVFTESVAKVWDAVVLAKHLKKHFIDDMKGEYSAKLTPVQWYWKDWGWWTAEVTKFVKHQELEYRINGMTGKYQVTIRYEFVKKDGKTIFRIHESGYDKKDLKTAFMMCEGWTEFHCGVKAYLKNGTILNK